MSQVARGGMFRNDEHIRGSFGVEDIRDKVRKHRLRGSLMVILELRAKGRLGRGRLNLTWEQLAK